MTLGGFIAQKTPKGRWISVHPDYLMDEADLISHDEMLDDEELLLDGEFDGEEDYEDPDSDGYGWERKALAGAWA